MSSRDTTINRSQPQQGIVVYETSDSPQLGSRLDATATHTTVRTASDPVELVAALTESMPDCLVCHYSAELSPTTDALYDLLARAAPALPQVAYAESTDMLSAAHERGTGAVHLRREADDAAVLAERVRAAIEAATDSVPELPTQLVAATADDEGRVRRATGGGVETVPDGPLWELPWAPSEPLVTEAIAAALADPGSPVSIDTPADATDLTVVADPTPSAEPTAETDPDPPAATDGDAATDSRTAEAGAGRLTVLGAVPTNRADDTISPPDGPAPTDEPTPTDAPTPVAEVERYEQILETVSDGVYALDPSGNFTYVNQGMADLTGYSRSALLGSHVSICKDDSTVERAEAAVREAIRRVQDDPEATGEISMEIEIRIADGETVPCEDHIALLPFDDRFRGSVGMLRDVSAQQDRERTLNGLLTVTRALMTAETTRAVADLVVEAVADVLGYDRAVVHLLADDSDQLRPQAATDAVTQAVDTLSAAVVGEGPVGSTLESGTPSIYDAEVADGSAYRDSEVLLSVPLGSYGTLTVGITDADAFTESDRQLVQLLTANAEEALNRTQRRQTLRRYEMILESVQEMMCVVDSTGQIKLLTDPLAGRLDRDRPELVGRQLSAFLAESNPDSNDGALADLFGEEATDITFEDRLIVGDGEPVPISVEASQLPHVDGRPEAVVTIHDISDLISAKEAAAVERERFTYLFENLTDPVDEIRVEDDGATINEVNGAFRSLFGEPADVAGAAPATDADTAPIALDDGQVVESDIDQPEAAYHTETERELKLTTTEGTKYFLYRTIPYELGETVCCFEIYTDITTLKQREIQLQVLHRLLRHNLRNDLNVISGFAEMLIGELDSDRHREFATRIHTNATQLAELSETAKTIESVAGHRSLDRNPIQFGKLVRGTVEARATRYDEATISLGELPAVTVAAGPHLETAIGELIENAIEHNDTAEPRVSITVETDAEAATVTVSDNGPGIPPEEWAVVTGDREISQLEHGSGLGLWLVRWVTEGYGGELTYHDNVPGSSISIRLPLADT